MQTIKYYFWMLYDAGKLFSARKAPRLGAALAFYTALAVAPLLLVVLAIVGFLFGEEAARGELVAQLQGVAGKESAEAIQTVVNSANRPTGGVFAIVIGIGTLLFAATGVFVQLQDALDTVWEVDESKTEGGIWGLIRERLLSLSMIGGMAFLLLVSMVASAFVTAFASRLDRWFPNSWLVLNVSNHLLTMLLTTLMFAIIFKVLPNAAIPWRGVWMGAILTAILFTVGKVLIGVYLGVASVGSAYGAAGSFVVLLMWIYYSTQILLFGTAFSRIYSQRTHPNETQTPTTDTPMSPDKKNPVALSV